MEKKIVNGSIELTKLKNFIMTTKKGAKCVCIPIEQNFLFEGKDDRVYMNFVQFLNEEADDYGNIGSLKQSGAIKDKKWSELTEEEKATINSLPYIGNVKELKASTGESNTAAVIKEGEEDDLPF